jgi:hypothetical protein
MSPRAAVAVIRAQNKNAAVTSEQRYSFVFNVTIIILRGDANNSRQALVI